MDIGKKNYKNSVAGGQKCGIIRVFIYIEVFGVYYEEGYTSRV